MKDKYLSSRERLIHIQKAISDIEKFLDNNGEKDFTENELLHNAVLMQFIIIGEAINNVEEGILEKYAYPWYKVRAFRNLIAHEYFNIKLSAVWNIIQNELNSLKTMINEILNNEF
jgi:uncharacterized protein with HEPN domain